MSPLSLRHRPRLHSLVSATLFFAAATLTLTAARSEAGATDAPIALGEISQPSAPTTGAAGAATQLDTALLRAAAEGEIKMIDASRLPSSRRIVVSLALTRSAVGGAGNGVVVCTVNGVLRDARTGAMIAIIEAGAHAQGRDSLEVRKQVAHAAIRSAVRRIPNALGAQ